MRPFGIKDKFGYLFGDFGNDFFFALVGSFLMVYYTDVFHLNPAAVGGLFLIARLWDAIADITWGRFIDTRKAGKHGKFKPWIYRMSFPLVISGILMFIHIPGMSNGFYTAYAYVTYILWGTLYSTVNIPYGSMASVITADPVERTTLSTWRSLGAALAQLIVGVAGPLILFVDNKADANQFLVGAIIFGILSISSYMACYKLSIERVVRNEDEQPNINLAKTLKGISKNRPLIVFLIGSLLFLINLMLIGSVNTYLFKDYFGDAKLLSVFSMVQSATIFIGMPMAKPLVARFGKKEVASAGFLLSTLAYLVLYFLPNVTATIFICILSVGLFGYALFNLISWAFITDLVDYHEYLTGLREDATIYSIYSFSRKVGQAVAGGIGGVAIAAAGYNPTLQVQTQETLDGIHRLATLIPALGLLLVFICFAFLYPLNKKRTTQLVSDLERKRSEKNSSKPA
ncbi:MFS transporter [Niallia circulans]|jgi:glycoside/pentoside/hexuronide:cation symporter, GPH family|uniref:MFS transporter n=1 Tax=Niallia circulans TaxID=1397 RepID=UPI00031FEF12|nr:MFS transporter [Niallia circulans]AYV69704.1 MFS transporter [Niallia circulans]AYV71900.1 MFS transporter [Niallia circulans]